MTEKACSFITLVRVLAVALAIAACSREEPKMSSGNSFDYRQVALEFGKLLAGRQYLKAYALTSQGYRQTNTVDQLQTAFEAIVPTDWGPTGPIELGYTMRRWPAKQPSDLGWAYVGIGGEFYNEGITVVVTSDNGKPKIREIEFGRP